MENELLEKEKEKIRKAMASLKKFARKVQNDSIKIMNEDFDNYQWEKEGKNIKDNIKRFTYFLKLTKQKVYSDKIPEETRLEIIQELDMWEDEGVSSIQSMKEKINEFEPNLTIEEIHGWGFILEGDDEKGQYEYEEIEDDEDQGFKLLKKREMTDINPMIKNNGEPLNYAEYMLKIEERIKSKKKKKICIVVVIVIVIIAIAGGVIPFVI